MPKQWPMISIRIISKGSIERPADVTVERPADARGYVLVQKVESALIIPLVQKRTVLLAPGVTVFAVVAFGILFGSLGVVFATPLTVICMVLVKKLWIRDALDEQTRLPGESPL
jgi:hypothetical protein